MKTVKQLLWFIIPTAFIWALIYVVTFIPSDSLPGFLSEQDYLTLFIGDTFFLKEFLKILIRPFCFIFFIGLILYIVKFNIEKSGKTYINKAFYTSAFTICSAFFYFLLILRLVWVFLRPLIRYGR
jgi:hypothetical protein